jgi:type I restriction enzyme M protein
LHFSGDFSETEISKIFNTEDFGYSKITVERSLKDESGNPILKKGQKQPYTLFRGTEKVSLTEDIQEYFSRDVLPFASDKWIDESKAKKGCEIPSHAISAFMKRINSLLELHRRFWKTIRN